MLGLEFIVKMKNIEYKDIANYLGISSQAVSDWVKGKRKIPDNRSEQLSKYLGIDKELIYKDLSEDEKLKLHYKLSEIKDLKSNMEENNVSNFTQIKFNIEEYNDDSKEVYTTSDLEKKIREERRKIKIKDADIMVSQLKEMYADRESIDVHPEFQRVFRWTSKQKSRFIESILLGIPIPPIFVAEDEDLNWDIIDGVQRLSTIFEFLGILKDDENRTLKPSVLVQTKTLKELEGKVWDNKYYEHKFSFEQNKYLKNAFLNATLRIIKVDTESDPKAKYDIFDRLNTGGSRLSPQEIRNCLAIMLNRNFYTWLRQLSYNPDFIGCMPLSDNAIKEQDDLEYVLRFLVYRNIKSSEFSSSDELTELITDKMRELCITDSLNYEKEKDVFDKTFELLQSALGDDAFKKYYSEKDRFKGGVMISSFEIIAIGISNNLEDILKLKDPTEYIKEKVKNLYSNKKYLELQKAKIASQRGVTRFSILTKFGTEYFSYK